MPVIKRFRIIHLLILRDRPRIMTKPKEQVGSVPARGAAENPAACRCSDHDVDGIRASDTRPQNGARRFWRETGRPSLLRQNRARDMRAVFLYRSPLMTPPIRVAFNGASAR
jgi:hypothetical protein